MNLQDPFKIVQSWTGYHLVVSGKHCRIINDIQKNLIVPDYGVAKI